MTEPIHPRAYNRWPSTRKIVAFIVGWVLAPLIGAYIYQTIKTYQEYSKQYERWKSLGGYELQDVITAPDKASKNNAESIKSIVLRFPSLMEADKSILSHPFWNPETERLVQLHSDFYPQLDKIIEKGSCGFSVEIPRDTIIEFKDMKSRTVEGILRARLAVDLDKKDDASVISNFNKLLLWGKCWNIPTFPYYKRIGPSYTTRLLKDLAVICQSESQACDSLSSQVSDSPPFINLYRDRLLEQGSLDLQNMKEFISNPSEFYAEGKRSGLDAFEDNLIASIFYQGPLGYFWKNRDRAMYLDRLSILIEKAGQHYTDCTRTLEIEQAHLPWWAPFAQVLLPRTVHPSYFLPETLRRIIKTASEIREYRKDYGHFPEAPVLPIETLTGQPIRYQVTGSGFMLWSDLSLPDTEEIPYKPIYIEGEIPETVLQLQRDKKLVAYFE